ncbi:MAG: membrane protein insertion efficiency factor YidD [Patescibacteria group bacterium]
MKNFLKVLRYWPRFLIVWLIKIYQKTLSLDHGPLKVFHPHGYCRFYPSCSQYGVEAISRYGIFRGGVMTSYRILRCNPWNKGGIDQVK